MIYLDNAATSYPKPDSVIKALAGAMITCGANPGRGGYEMAYKSAERVYDTRCLINELFNGYGPEYVSFTLNCTQSLNFAIKGILEKGDHVIISSLEHNSVSRPVNSLSDDGFITYDVFRVSENEEETIRSFCDCFKRNTRLCVITAVSNVFGTMLPVKRLCEEAHSRGAVVIVDGAQGGGLVPFDMKETGADCLCVPGHKGLLGPMGTGALLHNGIPFKPLVLGGTGTESLSLSQGVNYPEYLESGTLNVPGICALGEGVRCVLENGVENIFLYEREICNKILSGLGVIKGVELYCREGNKNRGPIVAFNISGYHSETIANALGRESVYVRGGYQCSSLAHKFYGTVDRGVVRISPSCKTSEKDINILLNLVNKIAFNKFI